MQINILDAKNYDFRVSQTLVVAIKFNHMPSERICNSVIENMNIALTNSYLSTLIRFSLSFFY